MSLWKQLALFSLALGVGVACGRTTGAQNCGKCANACPSGALCSGGSCVCIQGTVCGGLCTDIFSDPKNCGACGTLCPPNDVCSNGQCLMQCGPGLFNCNNACV